MLGAEGAEESALEAAAESSGTAVASSHPAPNFSVLGAEFVKGAAAPSMRFTVGITDSTNCEIYTIALTGQIHIDPVHRSYDPETREKLIELFGEPHRWATTTRSFLWTTAFSLVPSFSGATTVEIQVPSNFDLELAATKYFYSLPNGEVPLSFHFSGSIFYRAADGRIQLVQIPWASSARFRLPVATWRRMVDYYYPNAAWIGLRRETLDRLMDYKARAGLHTFDACLAELLAAPGLTDRGPSGVSPRASDAGGQG
jgi:hypothetical protein